MKQQLRAFVEHLRLNRNASAHTVRAYDSDVSQFLTFLAGEKGRPTGSLAVADFDTTAVRGFLAELYRRGNSRASAGRKLAAVRAFGRFLRREGVLGQDPAALVGTPKREQKIPAHLDMDETVKLLETPDTSTALVSKSAAASVLAARPFSAARKAKNCETSLS